MWACIHSIDNMRLLSILTKETVFTTYGEARMRVVFAVKGFDEWALFNDKGAVVPVNAIDVSDGSKAVALVAGVHWLFRASHFGASIRYFVTTDAYPLGGKETLETDIHDISFNAFGDEGVTKARAQMEIISREGTHPAHRFPGALIDAVCKAAEKSREYYGGRARDR